MVILQKSLYLFEWFIFIVPGLIFWVLGLFKALKYIKLFQGFYLENPFKKGYIEICNILHCVYEHYIYKIPTGKTEKTYSTKLTVQWNSFKNVVKRGSVIKNNINKHECTKCRFWLRLYISLLPSLARC